MDHRAWPSEHQARQAKRSSPAGERGGSSSADRMYVFIDFKAATKYMKSRLVCFGFIFILSFSREKRAEVRECRRGASWERWNQNRRRVTSVDALRSLPRPRLLLFRSAFSTSTLPPRVSHVCTYPRHAIDCYTPSTTTRPSTFPPCR